MVATAGGAPGRPVLVTLIVRVSVSPANSLAPGSYVSLIVQLWCPRRTVVSQVVVFGHDATPNVLTRTLRGPVFPPVSVTVNTTGDAWPPGDAETFAVVGVIASCCLAGSAPATPSGTTRTRPAASIVTIVHRRDGIPHVHPCSDKKTRRSAAH